MRDRRPMDRTRTALDVAALVWVVCCVGLGVRVAEEVRGLDAVTSTIAETGRQVEAVGTAVESLDLPLVGDRVEQAGKDIRAAGADTRESAARARDSTRTLSTLLGFAVAIIPASPLLFFYLANRVARSGDRRALQRLCQEAQRDPQLRRLLAHRALMTMSYRELEQLGGRPWAELADGRYERLADAEVERTAGGPGTASRNGRT